VSINPYESPQTAFEPVNAGKLPSFKLYTPGHVAWATFLGAPLAGSMLLAMNYRRLGEPTSAAIALVGGFLATTGLVVIGFCLPDNFPNMIIPIASLLGMAYLTRWLQGDSLANHLANGGDKASGWGATGVGLLSLVVVLGIGVGLAMLLPEAWLGD
jgi:hypothetical protein